MFCRTKTTGGRTYLQIVESRRIDGKPRQRVIATLGRLDRLTDNGKLDRLIESASRFSSKLLAISEASARSRNLEVKARAIGPALLFGRLWQETGCAEVVATACEGRRFGFDVERAVFASVLHRLMESGSDRQACRWLRDQHVPGADGLELQHLYRAMGWLGEPLAGEPKPEPDTRFSPRCRKDRIEEELFDRRRNLFTSLDMVFFDTTSLYFHGEGGSTLGRRGKSKDCRPQCKQLVVGMVLDGDGIPVCSEIWPGNTADVTTLQRVVDRLERRFGLRSVCVVADRGMISKTTIEAIADRGWHFLLGARPRGSKEVRERVLTDPAPFEKVELNRARPDPLILYVKAVDLPAYTDKKGVPIPPRRYVVCRNPAQARKDAATREAILDNLRKALRSDGAKSLVGNRGYKRYLRAGKNTFEINAEAVDAEARLDGVWVLQTNTNLSPAEAAEKYKALWRVERMFRSCKSVLETRPVFHKRDETIRGHVFCSFLAMLLTSELERRMEIAGIEAEWADLVRDLNALSETEVELEGKRFLLRSSTRGSVVSLFRALRVKLPNTIRMIETPTTTETHPQPA